MDQESLETRQFRPISEPQRSYDQSRWSGRARRNYRNHRLPVDEQAQSSDHSSHNASSNRRTTIVRQEPNESNIVSNDSQREHHFRASNDYPVQPHFRHSHGRRGSRRGDRQWQSNADRQEQEVASVQHDTSQDYSSGRFPRRSRGRANLRHQTYRSTNHYIIGESPIVDENTLQHDQADASSNQEDSTRVQSRIAESQLRSNDFECMICCDNIRRINPIWYCDSCYNIFHLKCAIEWCNKSIKSRNEAIAQAEYPSISGQSSTVPTSAYASQSNEGYSNYRLDRMNSVEWPCPTCRQVLYSKPDKYKCFCGKVVKPEINKHLTPHSCGQLCGRKRPNADCPHSCNSICHPGRCIPCSLTSKRTCFCGKLVKEMKCSGSISSCGEVCSKPLSCGRHSCSRICHEGTCETCQDVLTLSCNCGNEVIKKRCSDISAARNEQGLKFSCDKVCGKLLECGFHYCEKICHSGPNCGSCSLSSSNIKTCPCGSTKLDESNLSRRKLCTDLIPTCGNKCNAILICGPEKNRHRCKKKCHSGPCPPCKLKTPAQCECKLSTRTIDCSLMFEKITIEDQVSFRQVKYCFTCETRCNKPKNCGKHRCNNKCCKFNNVVGASVHKCDQTCNKKLPCGIHTCSENCHPGQCGDCTNIGWEELSCHCGSSILYPPIPCGARRPICHRPCRRPHNCGHPVKHECHDDSEKCAPCIVFVKKPCFCGADSKDSVYCYLSGWSCGRTCKKQLKCGQHKCQKICHDNSCEADGERNVATCQQPCQVPRYLCKHPCGLPCHGSTINCPLTDCKRTIEVKCECGNKVERVECHKICRDRENRSKIAMLNMNRTNQDSIMINLSKSSNQKNQSDEGAYVFKKLDCDETCLILKRNKALAEALDIAEPDLKPVGVFGEDPLRLLREATVQDYKFVSSTFNSLVRFVKSAQESDKRFIFLKYPPTNKLRREVIHELAHHFNCISESREEEPFRHVVVKASKNKSCVPSFNVEQLLPVTS